MRSSILISIFLHAVVIAIGIFGLPEIRTASFVKDIPMLVEVVPSALATNIPSVSKLQKKLLKKKIKASEKVSPAKEKKVPVLLRTPKKKRKIVPAPPKLKPKARVKINKKPIAKLKVHKNLAKAKPRQKPKPPDRFAMVLKNLEKDFKNPIFKKKQTVKKKLEKETDLITRLAKSLSRQPTEFDSNKRVTMSERNAMINLIKRRMEPCWSFQAGSKKAQDIIVEIEVRLRPDGRVLGANITNRLELSSDPFKLAAGESALRAVLNPGCQPYILPANRYDVWKDLKLTFNPREMLGR